MINKIADKFSVKQHGYTYVFVKKGDLVECENVLARFTINSAIDNINKNNWQNYTIISDKWNKLKERLINAKA